MVGSLLGSCGNSNRLFKSSGIEDWLTTGVDSTPFSSRFRMTTSYCESRLYANRFDFSILDIVSTTNRFRTGKISFTYQKFKDAAPEDTQTIANLTRSKFHQSADRPSHWHQPAATKTCLSSPHSPTPYSPLPLSA